MALILTRRAGESIQIGPDITISVVFVEHGKVRLAINAPRDLLVLRSELLPPQDKQAHSQRT